MIQIFCTVEVSDLTERFGAVEVSYFGAPSASCESVCVCTHSCGAQNTHSSTCTHKYTRTCRAHTHIQIYVHTHTQAPARINTNTHRSHTNTHISCTCARTQARTHVQRARPLQIMSAVRGGPLCVTRASKCSLTPAEQYINTSKASICCETINMASRLLHTPLTCKGRLGTQYQVCRLCAL